MAIKCINFGTPTTVDELNDALNEGYKFQFTAGVVMWLHKPDPVDEVRERKAKAMGAYGYEARDDGSVRYLTPANIRVSAANPEALSKLIIDAVIDNGGSLDSARDLPHKTTSFNEWYGVRDIP